MNIAVAKDRRMASSRAIFVRGIVEGKVRRGGRVLRPRVHSNGYLRICLVPTEACATVHSSKPLQTRSGCNWRGARGPHQRGQGLTTVSQTCGG